jgi:thioredoxin 1
MRFAKRSGWAALILTVAVTLAGAAEPAVLSAIPEGSAISIVVPNLSALSAKVAMLNQKLQLNQPVMGDLLTFLKAMSGVNAGIDDKGSLAFVLPTVPDPQTGDQPKPLVLVSVSDYAAFMKNFGVEAAGEGATPVAISGQPSFSRKVGKFAVLAEQQELVDGYQAPAAGAWAKRAGALGGASLEKSDLFIVIDMKKLAPMVQGAMTREIGNVKQQFQNIPNGAMAAAMVDLYAAGISAIFRDGEVGVVGLNMTEAGFTLGYGAQFTPGSKLAAAFAKGPDKPLSLNKLPTKPYILAATMNLKSLPLEEWINQIAAVMPKDDPMTVMMNNAVKMLKAYQGEAQQAYYVPNLGAGGGPPSLLNGVAVMSVADPKQYNEAFKQYMESMNKFQVDGQNAPYQVAITPKAKQIAGIDADKYEMKINLPPEQMAQMGPAAMFLTQGMSGYTVVKDNHIIQSIGPDETLVADALATLTGSGKLDQSPGMAQVRKALPDHRLVEMYVGVGTLMQMVNGLLAFFAPQMVMEAPADLSPVAMSMSSNAGGMSFDLHVPMDVVIAGKKIADKAQQMRGPGAGAGAAPAGRAPQPDMPESKNVIAFTDATFQKEVLQSDKPVVVDFWAVWCGPCKQQAPIVGELADELVGKVKVGKLDIDANEKVTEQFKIEAIPTVIVFKGGKPVASFTGVTDKATLRAAIDKAMQ